MQRSAFQNWHPFELTLPLLTLALLVVFTCGIFVWAPYAGFYFNPTDGRVAEVFVPVPPGGPTLQADDVLQQVGPVRWQDYYENGDQAFFAGVLPGQTVEILVQRSGVGQIKIAWVFPGFSTMELGERLVNLWWIAYVFWFFGIITQLFMRPKDLAWRLFVTANYLTAIWLIVGDLSSWHILGSSLWLHTLSWLMPPVYLGLHWVFPKPLGRVSRWNWVLLFAAGGALALAELVHALPRPAYAIGIFLAFGGSILLLVAHFIWQRDQRREVLRLALAFGLALGPLVLLGLLGSGGSLPAFGPLAFLALPLMPLAYFYAIYRNRLGNLQLRLNRAISIYVFLALITTLAAFSMVFLPLAQVDTRVALVVALAAAALSALAAILFFSKFQSWVERRLLGVRLPDENLSETYAARIATSPSAASLEGLLRNELLPSLLVRQFVFIQLQGGAARPFLSVGIRERDIPDGLQVAALIAAAGQFRPPDEKQSANWVRLALPLRVGDELLGCWLLGRRDPDDIYSQAEIPILQALANQTAIALSNILQAARLRKMYQSDIERNERQRLRLSHELHDDVLNEMAVLLMSPAGRQLPDGFKQGYARLTQRVREIASDLRPPTLNYGLASALTELADNLMERTHDTVSITVEIKSDEARYPEAVEKNLFRIIQQGLENALRHGHPTGIRLTGHMDADGVRLLLADDGAGFETGATPDIAHLLEGKHFGLAGMFERAALIGAKIEIASAPGQGTRITLAWRAASIPADMLTD